MRAIAVVAAALTLALAASATGAPSKQCAPVRHAFSDYAVYAHGKSCTFARKWVLRRLRHGTKPKGWRCFKPAPGSNVQVDCRGKTKPKGDSQFRSYLGVRQ